MNISFRSLDKLNRWESFGFLQDAVNFTENHSEGMPELFNTKFAAFSTAFEAFDDALVQEQKLTSKGLIEAEEGRDLAVRKLYALVREYSQYPYDTEKETAGKVLMHVFKPYGTGSSIAMMPQKEETSVLINLIQDFYNKEAAIQALRTLGLINAMEALEIHNASFIHEKQQKTKDDAHAVLGIVKTTRTEAQNTFIAFQDIVNALALVEGPEKYANLKTELNRLHKETMDRVNQRTKKKEEEEEEEVEPEVIE